MSAHAMLEQLLKSGLSMLDAKSAGSAPVGDHQPDTGWGKFAGGAAAGGVMGLLLGSKGGRRIGGKALKYGSVAALGVMAYRAYGNWQAGQQRNAAAGSGLPSTGPLAEAPAGVRTVNLLPAPEVELHSRAMLMAMIAAAKSDGHLDARERGLVESELARAGADTATRLWFEEELRRPLDPAQVAQGATTPETAAEMYLASLLVVDETVFMERAYLDELARQLRLPETLKRELEQQALAA
jgi:uncharacterized membrane protein YebE (DUF533 family)